MKSRASGRLGCRVLTMALFWKGYLRLPLVSCPAFPATSERAKIRFHPINSKTGNRIRYLKVDAVTDEPLDDNSVVKACEISKGSLPTAKPQDCTPARTRDPTRWVDGALRCQDHDQGAAPLMNVPSTRIAAGWRGRWKSASKRPFRPLTRLR